MNMNDAWQDIPHLPGGEIDFGKIRDNTVNTFWNAVNRKIDSIPPELPAQIAQDAERLSKALQSWISGTGYGGNDELLTDFLYGGDPTLKWAFAGRYSQKKRGLSVKLARRIQYMRSLRSLFYYYQLHYSEYTDKVHDKYRFIHILLENVRAWLKDVKDSDPTRFCGQPVGEKKVFYLLENLCCNYDVLKTPARKIRLNRLMEEQRALPDFKAINEKVELLKSISECSVKTHSVLTNEKHDVKLSDLLCDTFTPFWDKHINAAELDREEDGKRINSEISTLLDNLTFGELRDSEKMKNRESGEKGRSIHRALSSAESRDKQTAMKRLQLLRVSHESLDSLDENGRSGYDKLEHWEDCSVYCPEDISEKVWKRLSKNEKAYLYTGAICSELPSCAGFKGILQKLLNCKISYMSKNIQRIVLEEILSIELPEIKGSNQDMVLRIMKKMINDNDCEEDMKFNLSLLCSCPQRHFVRNNLQEYKEIAEIADAVFQQLSCIDGEEK
jgi:hypothetical protein